MSREIKFRAWGGESMHLDVSVIDGVAIIRGYEATSWSPNAKAGKLMQYTGLKDKNGVEIYEGDIIKCRYDSLLRPVIFDCGAFDTEGLFLPDDHNEVVGNIYQHPELLEEQ